MREREEHEEEIPIFLLVVCHQDAKGMGDDDYFFGMDHFYHMLRYFHDHPEKIVEGPIPSDMEAAMNKKLEVLENAPVLDAKRMGNVGRFINHSNDGNLVIQPVITEPNHSLIFYRCLTYLDLQL